MTRMVRVFYRNIPTIDRCDQPYEEIIKYGTEVMRDALRLDIAYFNKWKDERVVFQDQDSKEIITEFTLGKNIYLWILK